MREMKIKDRTKKLKKRLSIEVLLLNGQFMTMSAHGWKLHIYQAEMNVKAHI